MFEDIDSKKAASSEQRQRIMWILACYVEILKEKKSSLSRQSPELDFCKSFSVPHISPSLFWTLQMVIHVTGLQIRRNIFSLNYHLLLFNFL